MDISGNRSQNMAQYGQFHGPALLKRFYQLPWIKSIGKMILDPVWGREMHRSGFNELMHVIRGNVAVKLDKNRLKAGPGDTLLIPGETMHCDEFDLSIGLEVFYVFFDWPPSHDYFRLVPPDAVPSLDEPVTAEIGRLCDRIQIGLDAGTETDQLLISSYTHNILMLILRETLRSDKRHNLDDYRHHGKALLFKARQYIDLHYSEQISLDQIADNLKISPFYLSHLFSRESDFTLVEYLTQLRMQKARELLAVGAKNVSEVAYAVGYNDSNYFSKVFHRYFGVSPQAARYGQSGRKPAKHPLH